MILSTQDKRSDARLTVFSSIEDEFLTYSRQFMEKLNMKQILVTGGAGFVGSHVVKLLGQKGYTPITYDNLSMGTAKSVIAGEFIQGDLADLKVLDQVFATYSIAAVMHLAGSIDIRESISDPAFYYGNNLANTLNLLNTMCKYDVKHLIFSSSAAIFGYPKTPKITESHPMDPISPYGRSKLYVEKILEDFDAAYGIKSSCLRYFNAAGGDPDGLVKNCKKKESNIIPLILKSQLAPNGWITLFGTDYNTPDGTCVRDYIHVLDIANAHILALEQIWKNGVSTQYNLGNGNGFSLREVVETATAVTGKPVRVIDGPRRPGDPAILIADSTKAQTHLGWTPQYPSLETIIADAWKGIA